MARQWQWDDVRIFLAVSREGTFSGAARALGVDHVTVARRIASLEERLGAKLLSRTSDGFETTPAGQAIIKQCESMEVAALGVERLIAGQDRRAAGQVRVTSTDAMADRFLIPVFVKLHVEHPELQVDLLTGVRKYDFARREADLAVRPSMARPSDARELGCAPCARAASRSPIVPTAAAAPPQLRSSTGVTLRLVVASHVALPKPRTRSLGRRAVVARAARTHGGAFRMMNGADRIEFTDVEVVDGGTLVLKCRIGGKIVYVPALRMLPGSTIHRYRGGNRGTLVLELDLARELGLV